MFKPTDFEPANTIDLGGKTLEGEALVGDTRYINGTLKYCTASKVEKLVIGAGITILMGEKDGLYLGGCRQVRIEPGVVVTTPEGVEGAKGEAGINFRGGGDFSIAKLKVEKTCTGIVMMEVDGYAIHYSDFRGCSEDGIRSFGSENGDIFACRFNRFRLVNESSHRDGVQIAPFYNAKEGPKRSRNITVRFCLFYVDKGGVEFTAIFNRPYLLDGTLEENPDKPNCENVSMTDNLCFTQGGHALVNYGDGETSRNIAVGYAGNAWASTKFADKHVVGKMGLTAFTGLCNDNQAENFYYRDASGTTWRPDWLPTGEGNAYVEPWTQEQIDEAIAGWVAEFRPEELEVAEQALPEGLSPAVLDFLDARFARLSA